MSKLVVTTIEDANGAAGTVTFTGDVDAVNFNSTSDARLKTDVNTIEGGLDKVSQMRGVTFRIHDKPSAGVITGDDDYKSVNYNVIIGYLIEAVKELQEEVNTLKG